MRSALMIVNPYSTHVTRERVSRVEAVLREQLEVRTALTEAPGHASELARGAAGDVDAIVVFSGDGTYNEAVNGTDGSLPLGFIPGGGTSVLPRALGLPRNPEAAAGAIVHAIRDNRLRRISLGRVNGRRFTFSAGIGFDAEAVRRLNALGRAADGARPGDVAFAKEVARMVFDRRGTWEPELEVEGYGRAAFALIANCDPYSYAGTVPLHVAPAARFELGLDFVAPERLRPRSLPRFVRMILWGEQQLEARDILSGHDLDRIVVRCDSPMPLQVDGEDLGDVAEATFEAERDAVSVLA